MADYDYDSGGPYRREDPGDGEAYRPHRQRNPDDEEEYLPRGGAYSGSGGGYVPLRGPDPAAEGHGPRLHPGLCPWCGAKLIVSVDVEENLCSNCERRFSTAEAVAQYNIRYGAAHTVNSMKELRKDVAHGVNRAADRTLTRMQERLDESRVRREEEEAQRRAKARRALVVLLLLLLFPALIAYGVIHFLHSDRWKALTARGEEISSSVQSWMEDANETIDRLLPQESAAGNGGAAAFSAGGEAATYSAGNGAYAAVTADPNAAPVPETPPAAETASPYAEGEAHMHIA